MVQFILVLCRLAPPQRHRLLRRRWSRGLGWRVRRGGSGHPLCFIKWFLRCWFWFFSSMLLDLTMGLVSFSLCFLVL
ncbi:unnamed protein product, partial [Musa textilis]